MRLVVTTKDLIYSTKYNHATKGFVSEWQPEGTKCAFDIYKSKNTTPILLFKDNFYYHMTEREKIFETVDIDFDEFVKNAQENDMLEALEIKVLRTPILFAMWKILKNK